MDGSIHDGFPPFSRFLNQSRKLSFVGAGNSRLSVQVLSGPGPFEMISPVLKGDIADGAILEPNL
ncbi:Uncharacterised protein [Chlamydia trachomatis]|nr:Uncharacterised protein [Chlamydia trachomatis]